MLPSEEESILKRKRLYGLLTVLGLFTITFLTLFSSYTHQGANGIIQTAITTSIPDWETYLTNRKTLVELDQNEGLNDLSGLSAQELSANEIWLDMVATERERVRSKYDMIPAQHNFMNSAQIVHESPLYDEIKSVPKGAVLHVHAPNTVDVRWLVHNATYHSKLYVFAGHTEKNGYSCPINPIILALLNPTNLYT